MAQDDNREAQSAMGSLCMWEPRHPAALTPCDGAKAAIRGNADAMAAMTETELGTHHPVSAPVRTLTDYCFREHGPPKPRSYTADLILRTREGLTATQRRQAITDADGSIARYGAGILAPRPGFASLIARTIADTVSGMFDTRLRSINSTGSLDGSP